MSSKRLVVIDGKSVFYRGYYAMPNLSKSDGTPTGGVYGFAVMALEVLKKYDPDYVCVAWDKAKTNIRRRVELYPKYKANRKPAPPDFYEQVPILHELLDALGWPLYEIDDHEADDIMGTFAKQASKKGVETILITSDKDVLQLITKDTKVATLKKGLTNVEMFDEKHFKEVYDMTTEQFIDYKSLRGDPSDNIPGVKGVGEKTATSLIKEFGSMDGVYENLDKIKGATKTKLEADKDMAYLTKKLVILDSDIPLELEWDKADLKRLNPAELKKKLEDLEFRTLLKQLPDDFKVDDNAEETTSHNELGEEAPVIVVRSKSDLPKLSAEHYFVHTYSEKSHGRSIKTLVFGDATQNYCIDVDSVGSKEVYDWLSDVELKIVGHDTKQDIKALRWLGVENVSVEHDIKIASFLIDSLRREQTLAAIAKTELGVEGTDFENIMPDEFELRAGLILEVLRRVYKVQKKQLSGMHKVEHLAEEVEWPVIPVLADMEMAGMSLNVEYLERMSNILEDKISDVTQIIYGHADTEFNISSPSQLAKVLYDDLKLPTHGVKKGKTGYSTAANELEKLMDFHPIIEHISHYRELTKLKSTYVDALPKQVDDDGRLRTTFSLTTAQTGRLSSHNPNLQNIPVRSDMGKEIRKAFVAGKGNVFVSADYSQFELRLVSVLAGDDELIEAFNDGLDIHTRTAAQVYGCALEDVTKEQRRNSKVINFGVLYGMSPHGLSRATGMSQVEAKDFIDRYFNLRQPIVDYIERTKELAKTQGYVETMFGRRRPTPDVHSSNYVVREAALRAAVNMPIQGTEADLMKMAMVEVQNHLDSDTHQLLQIHDSILIECPEERAEKVSKLVKGIMEGVYKMKVNLDVDVSIGKSWGDL